METMKSLLRWGGLLWKRLYKKATFVLLLILIPLLVLGYGMVSQEESGLLTIALASRAEQTETLTRAVWDDLMESQVILYIECDSPEAAEQMVRDGDADVAWIFEADLENKIYAFAAHRSRSNAFITVIEPERTVLLLLAREVLSGSLFAHCSEAMYITYIRENIPQLEAVDNETLLGYYRKLDFGDGLFEFTDIDGNVTQAPETEQNYLLTPVRGMLAVVAVLAGLATAMYYIRDEENGTFSFLPHRKRPAMELGCQLISLVNVLTVVILSLVLAGQAANLGTEVLVAVLYALCVAAFAMLVRRLTMGIRGLGMVTPILVVVMLVVCPVFFDMILLRQVQLLLPPTYYVQAPYNNKYLWQMALYTLVCLTLCALLDLRKPK